MLPRSLLVCLTLIIVLISDIASAANCDLQETCEKCLGVDECAWCESTSVGSYCFDAISNAGRCSEYGDKVLQFHEKKSVIVASQPLWFESILDDRMQIKPQFMREIHKIGLSRAINTSFEFEYSIADNAIDIYYLVDVTTFSSRYKRHLISLGRKLVTTMGKMSKNVRIGFGVINKSNDEASKCTKDQCNSKTRFVHLMNISPDTSYFMQLLRNISITNTERKDSNNLALVVQAIICEKNIGWRNDARRILVISTNSATSYLNGEEYGWNVESDISCGIDEAGYYELTESNADVNFKTVLNEAEKHSVGLVVAVPSNVYREHLVYNKSAYVVEIVKNHYESIESHLEMKHNATDGVTVRFFTGCNEDSPKLESSYEKSKCRNVRKGDLIKFRVLIEVPPAESYHNFYQTIGIYARGKEDQRLSVEYNVTYRCPCENCDTEAGTDAPLPAAEQPGDRCDELKSCVECKMYKTGELSEEECQNCDIDPVGAPSVTESPGTVLCEVKDSENCEFSFTYKRESSSKLEVVAQEEPSCPKNWGDWWTF